MLLVTGGAGFIGSNVVAGLNAAGCTDVVVNDRLRSDGKWRNLQKRQVADLIPPAELSDWLKGRKLDAVIHLGAISSTTATDGDQVIENNFRLSLRLLDWCTMTRTPFIYASSAATYGDGEAGFVDDNRLPALVKLPPLHVQLPPMVIVRFVASSVPALLTRFPVIVRLSASVSVSSRCRSLL